MSKYTVFFDVRKGNVSTTKSTTVDAESDLMAERIAEGKLKSQSPTQRDYVWTVKKITKK